MATPFAPARLLSARPASTAQGMGPVASRTEQKLSSPQQQQQQQGSESPERPIAAAAASAVVVRKPLYTPHGVDFEGGMYGQVAEHVRRMKHGMVRYGVPPRYRNAARAVSARKAYSEYATAPVPLMPSLDVGESKYGSHTETKTRRREEDTNRGEAPPLSVMWARPINMEEKAYCRVTRTYESAGISGNSLVGGLGVDTGNWTKLYMGGFNTNLSALTGFFPAGVTIGNDSACCYSFHFDTSVITGVDGTVGPRIVRGGPTSADYVTQSMLQAEGWTEWNNDFYMFSNIFRYSRLDKLEMRIKVTPHTQSGYVGTDGAPYTNNAIAYQDVGTLLIAPWDGRPGIVNSYTSGNGNMTSNASNGARSINYWESLPGVKKIDLAKGYSRDQYQIYDIPIKPIQPAVVSQSTGTGNPITGADTVVTYNQMPDVDGFAFVAGAANHNAFGWTMYWYHPDFNGMVVGNGATNTVIPPWIEVSFRAQMTYWGLLPPDMTAGTAPILEMAKLPGAEEARQKCFATYAAQVAQQKADLEAGVTELKAVLQQNPPTDYVQVEQK